MVTRRAGRPARRMGRDRQRAAQLRRAVGWRRRHVRPASGPRPRRPAQSAGAVSIPRRATRLRFRHPSHQHESVGDGARGDPTSDTRAARCRRGRRSRRPPAARGAPAGCATASPARWCPAPRRRTRCGRPASWRSARPPTPCSAGPPTRGRGCPPCPRLGDRPAAALPSDRAPRCRDPWLSG